MSRLIGSKFIRRVPTKPGRQVSNSPASKPRGEAMSPIQALVLSALQLPTTSYQQEKLEGTWEAEFRAARVHLNLRMDRDRGYSNYGRTFPASELSNLRREGRDVSFELR